MKFIKILIILFLIASFSGLKSAEANDVLKNKILKNIRCLICQGQSVYDSESEFASSIKLIVDRKINEGLKEKQIYQFLREKYGDWVVFDPKLNKKTYVLWLLPLLLFLLGGVIMKKKLMYGQIPNFLLQQSYGYHQKAEKVYNYNLLTFLGFNVMETTLLLMNSNDPQSKLF